MRHGSPRQVKAFHRSSSNAGFHSNQPALHGNGAAPGYAPGYGVPYIQNGETPNSSLIFLVQGRRAKFTWGASPWSTTLDVASLCFERASHVQCACSCTLIQGDLNCITVHFKSTRNFGVNPSASESSVPGSEKIRLSTITEKIWTKKIFFGNCQARVQGQ